MATVNAKILEMGELPRPPDDGERVSLAMFIKFDSLDEFKLAMSGHPVELGFMNDVNR